MQLLTTIDPEWTSLVIAAAVVLPLALLAWLLAGAGRSACRRLTIRHHRQMLAVPQAAVRDVARGPERLLGRVERGIGRCRLAHQHQLAARLQLDALELELDRLKSDILDLLPGRIASRVMAAPTMVGAPSSLAIAA